MHMKIGWSWDYESLPSAHPLLWGDYPHIIIYMFVGTLDMTLYLMITHLLLDIHDCILVSVIRIFGGPWEIWVLMQPINFTCVGPTDTAHRSFLMVQYRWAILLVRLIIILLSLLSWRGYLTHMIIVFNNRNSWSIATCIKKPHKQLIIHNWCQINILRGPGKGCHIKFITSVPPLPIT